MTAIDAPILHFINSFARRSPAFDATVTFINNNDLMKGGVIMALLWWCWFNGRNRTERRQAILAAVLAGFVAIVLGRIIADFLPFRLRPLHDPSVHFTLPYGARPYDLKLWSSFPSQHTLFFIALGTGMLFVSPLIGAFTIAHTLIFIALPRVYLGLHYPTDIAAGAVIGALVACTLNVKVVKGWFAPRLLAWHDRHPSAFYAMFFLVTLELSSMFAGAIDLLKLIVLGPKSA